MYPSRPSKGGTWTPSGVKSTNYHRKPGRLQSDRGSLILFTCIDIHERQLANLLLLISDYLYTYNPKRLTEI